MPGVPLEAIILVAAVSWFLVTLSVLALMYFHGRRIRKKRERLTRRQSGD